MSKYFTDRIQDEDVTILGRVKRGRPWIISDDETVERFNKRHGNNMKNNVLVITHNFPRDFGDVPGNFLLTLYDEIKDSEITVLAPSDKNFSPGLQYGLNEIDIKRYRYWLNGGENLAYRGDMGDKVIGSIKGKVKFLSLIINSIFSAVRIIRKKKIDLIHAHWWIPGGVTAYIVSKITRVPYIVHCHGTDIRMLQKFRSWRPLARRIFKNAHSVLTVSSFLRRQLAEVTGLSGETIKVLPMPYNDKIFNDFNRYGRKDNYILAVGRYHHQKGWYYLIKAVDILIKNGQEVYVDIIGNGVLKRNLQKTIDRFGISKYVRLVGSRSPLEVGALIRKATMVVLPSFCEGFGMIIAEALACGTPVIGSDDGGITDIIQPNCGQLVRPGDYNGLMCAIKHYLDYGGSAQSRASIGQEFVQENFSPVKIAERLKRIYNEPKVSIEEVI